MTRKQMEQKIEELSAELAELRKAQACSCHGHCHGHCIHWHYNYPLTTGTTYIPWQSTYTMSSGNYGAIGGGQYTITTS